MAEISIDRSTFPVEGGSFKISITKEDPGTWGMVTVPTAAWYEVGEMTDVSQYLYTIDVTVEENTGASRSMTIGVTVDGLSEAFTITQPAASSVAANIVAYTGGNTPAAGGQVTVDVQSVNGNDSLSTASSDQSYCTLTSTTHNVTSGGVQCTRFVFTFAQNTGSSSRSATFTFTVSDGNSTATATLTKSQNGASVQTGTLAVADASATATATSATAVISMTSVQVSTLAVDTTTFSFVTSAAIQVAGGSYVLGLSFPANTGSSRSETVQISATDNWGNTLTATMTITQAAAGATTAITASWDNSGSLGYEGGTETATITYTGTFSGSATVTTGTLPDGVTVALASNTQLKVTYTGGNVRETSYIPVTVKRTGTDSVVYSADLVFVLLSSGVFPIWEDVFGTIASDEDWEDYELQQGGTMMYSGRAFAYPDEEDIRVNVSRVVAPYLTSYYKDIDFVSGGTVLGSYTFVRDYSYDRSMDYTQDIWLNRPINGKVPAGVKLSASMWGASAGGAMQVAESGGSLVVNRVLAKGMNTGEWISGSTGSSYTFGDEKYTVVDVCRGALLKYVNAYGAVDFFLVEGVAKKTDKLTRSSYEKDAAAMTTEYEGKDYQNEMEAQWNGTTGWLTDVQSLRMKHLVESVEVYMVDQATGMDIPVQMTDNQLLYKTFDNNGRKMVNYSIAWKESQKKIRR